MYYTDHKLKNKEKKRGRPGNEAIGSTGTHTSGVVSFLMHTKCITYTFLQLHCLLYRAFSLIGLQVHMMI